MRGVEGTLQFVTLKATSGQGIMCAVCQQEELQKRIVEEQQNNNLSVEILNGNAELLPGLVGNAHVLKEPGRKD